MSYDLFLTAKNIIKRPYLLFFAVLFFFALSVFLLLEAFPAESSILVIVFTMIPIIPLFVKLIELQEERLQHKPYRLTQVHLLKLYGYLFLGVILMSSFFYFFLPTHYSEKLFSSQYDALYDLSAPLAKFSDYGLIDCSQYDFSSLVLEPITSCKVIDFHQDGSYEYLLYVEGKVTPQYVYFVEDKTISDYRGFVSMYFMSNNLSVLMFVFLTSFIFGAGALFVLLWNASIIGVFMGEYAIKFSYIFSNKLLAYLWAIPMTVFALIFHGFFEFLGFFMGAIAGGILSVGIIRHKFLDAEFKHVFVESSKLLLFAVLSIIFAAVIEAW